MKIYEEVDKNGKKIDARILRSKRDLADSLESLLEKKNYDDITIKEICEGALVSKLTFYNNFYDKNELLKFMFARRIKELSIKINSLFPTKKSSNEVYKDVIKIIIHYFYENKEKFKKMVSNDRSYVMFWNINTFVYELSPLIAPIYNNLINFDAPKELILSYYVGAFANIIYTLNKKDIDINESDMVNYVYKLTLGAGFKNN
ncbi:MAG: TetR/AcrR family transcriptional regulator [Mollicutes bacterium]|nr:TetR/AcrR family transcriptional regulator [Mollicutes bacterium]MDD7264134.1 TetR/AcrR family transcriptional regulator [bacterium]MDY4980099.1 TetR/AcrR family transcriptional regulator [Candidatus Onthovivens sp.]